MTEVHEGGCACGAVRYRTAGAPKRVSLCSCSWCRTRTGSAFGISVYFAEPEVTFVQGALQPWRRIADSGRWLEAEFCPTCGTTVTWTLEAFPDFRGLAGGTFDPPTFWYRPERWVYADSRPEWLQIPPGLEVCPEMAPVGFSAEEH